MYEHINHLQEIRKALVEKRRGAARTSVENAAANKEPLASTSWAAEIKLIQEQLKAIDEAVAEEKRSLTGSRLERTQPFHPRRMHSAMTTPS